MFGITPYEKKNYDLFDAFNDFEKSLWSGEGTVNAIRTDIKDEGDRYTLEADMPGFDKEDIRLGIEGDYLVLSAEKKTETEEKDKKGRYIRRERSFGSYKRSFDISDVDAAAIDAAYKDGVLTLNMPKKKEEEKARSIEIR